VPIKLQRPPVKKKEKEKEKKKEKKRKADRERAADFGVKPIILR
jgi:hypothetical protein